MNPTKRKRFAVIYARFSPQPGAKEKESLLTQLSRCRQWAASLGVEVLTEHCDEAISGKSADNRPGLTAALDDACKEKALLIVYSLSRLARNTRETLEIAERIEKAGADLASITENIDTSTPSGRLFFTIMAALAEFEREQISQRTSEALQRRKAEGRQISSRIPYGYRSAPDKMLEVNGALKRVRMLEEDPAEQAMIRDLLKLFDEGYTNMSELCRMMPEQGWPKIRDKGWHHAKVRKILQATGRLEKITR